MIISIKDTIKHFGISIVTFCAIFISTLFINYYLDILDVKDILKSKEQISFYDTQVSISKLLCMICCSILMFTSVVMLFFYIKQYISAHGKELGILKALGFSNMKIAKSFWVFGINVLIGTGLGFASGLAFMSKFYEVQNKSEIIPNFDFSFHPILLLLFVLVPSVVFSIFAVLYASLSLRRPVYNMLKCFYEIKVKNKVKKNENIRSFKSEMKSATRRSSKLLIFFIMFSALCFAAITQASIAIKDFAGDLMRVMILIIGIILSVTMMCIAVSTVVSKNKNSIAMMRVVGYNDFECYSAVLGCYRFLAYFGFIIGTLYQYGLMRIMIEAAFSQYDWYQPYKLEFNTVLISSILFVTFYELSMLFFSKKMKNISIKQIMIT